METLLFFEGGEQGKMEQRGKAFPHHSKDERNTTWGECNLRTLIGGTRSNFATSSNFAPGAFVPLIPLRNSTGNKKISSKLMPYSDSSIDFN